MSRLDMPDRPRLPPPSSLFQHADYAAPSSTNGDRHRPMLPSPSGRMDYQFAAPLPKLPTPHPPPIARERQYEGFPIAPSPPTPSGLPQPYQRDVVAPPSQPPMTSTPWHAGHPAYDAGYQLHQLPHAQRPSHPPMPMPLPTPPVSSHSTHYAWGNASPEGHGGGYGGGASWYDGPSSSSSMRIELPRKRLRNSRSCAECQRRKTRCDAVGAFPAEGSYGGQSPGGSEEDMVVAQPCTNCIRGGVDCQYSRRPAKRGPSKGYIKDLESRINTLQEQTSTAGQEDGHPSHHYSSPTSSSREGPACSRQTSVARSSISSGHRPSTISSPPSSRPSRPWEEAEASQPSLRKRLHDEVEQVPATVDEVDELEPPADEQELRDASDSEAAETMVELAHKKIKLDAEGVAQHGNTQSANEVSESAKPAAPSAPAIASIRSLFAKSDVNATFAIRPFEAANGGEPDRTGLNERLVSRAMKLCLEPASPSTPAGNKSRASSPPSCSSSSTAARGLKPHPIRLAHLQGQAIAGLQYNRADGLLDASSSGLLAVRAARKMAAATASLEADALLLCYLDGLRHGNADSSALAAAASKVATTGTGAQLSPEEARRRSVLFTVDRWHAFAFNAPHVMHERMLPGDALSHQGLISSLGDLSRSPLGNAPAEVLRAALMFGSLNELAHQHGGWKNVSVSDCESIIHSCGASEDDDGEVASVGGEKTIYSIAALRYSLRGAVRLHYRLQTLPTATAVTLKTVSTLLETLEECILAGKARTPIDPQTLLMRSFIGPHVFALAACALVWLSRAVALLAKQSYEKRCAAGQDAAATASTSTTTPAPVDDGTELEYLRRVVHDYSRMIGSLTFFASTSPGTDSSSEAAAAAVRPLYLRIAAFNHSTVSYLAALGKVSLTATAAAISGEEEEKEDSPLRDPVEVLRAEVDGRAEFLAEMGPLGLVLGTTTSREAWQMIGRGEDVVGA